MNHFRSLKLLQAVKSHDSKFLQKKKSVKRFFYSKKASCGRLLFTIRFYFKMFYIIVFHGGSFLGPLAQGNSKKAQQQLWLLWWLPEWLLLFLVYHITYSCWVPPGHPHHLPYTPTQKTTEVLEYSMLEYSNSKKKTTKNLSYGKLSYSKKS